MRYAGAIRVHVKGTSQRTLVPEAVIDDLTVAGWKASSGGGTLPTPPAEGPVDVLVELMDGDHAGWTAHGRITTRDAGDELEGTDPFAPGV